MSLVVHILSIPLAWAGIAGPDTMRGQVTAVIGEDAPRTPFLLGEISGIAMDDSGRIYVADFQEPRVVVFAPDGRHLATIGRKGRGPGEFTAPTGLATRFDRALSGPAMAPWRSKLASSIRGTPRARGVPGGASRRLAQDGARRSAPTL